MKNFFNQIKENISCWIEEEESKAVIELVICIMISLLIDIIFTGISIPFIITVVLTIVLQIQNMKFIFSHPDKEIPSITTLYNAMAFIVGMFSIIGTGLLVYIGWADSLTFFEAIGVITFSFVLPILRCVGFSFTDVLKNIL